MGDWGGAASCCPWVLRGKTAGGQGSEEEGEQGPGSTGEEQEATWASTEVPCPRQGTVSSANSWRGWGRTAGEGLAPCAVAPPRGTFVIGGNNVHNNRFSCDSKVNNKVYKKQRVFAAENEKGKLKEEKQNSASYGARR